MTDKDIFKGRKLVYCNKCGWQWWIGILSAKCGGCGDNDIKVLEVRK
jgi:hypothetical protein